MLPKDIESKYALAREVARAQAQRRREEAYSLIPALEPLERERVDAAFSLGVELRAATDAAAKEECRRRVKAKLASLDAERMRLLADNGLPPDYLEVKYNCGRCGDTGFLPDGTLCPCAREQILSMRYASSGLNANARFELFSTSVYRDEEQRRRSIRARELCELYAGELSLNGAPGLLIMGDTGLGKTFLLDCIGRRALEHGVRVEKYTAYNMIDMMLRSVRERVAPPDLTSAGLLLIDDLGSEPIIPSITFEALFAAINERGNAGLATAIATNLSKAAILEQYGERIFSRLFDRHGYSAIELKGSDLRLG